ncbi:MAG: hypothetical protein RL007_270 [Bacteroidota bacterium]|jgi:hypothetical protein
MKTVQHIYISALIMLFVSCSKEEFNERRLAGIWEAKEVQYLFYTNNEVSKDSVVANSGALYLWDDDELDNQWKHSMSITPLTFSSAQSWSGSATKKESTLLGLTIRKHTRKKLELVEVVTDPDLNLISETVYYFERQ